MIESENTWSLLKIWRWYKPTAQILLSKYGFEKGIDYLVIDSLFFTRFIILQHVTDELVFEIRDLGWDK